MIGNEETGSVLQRLRNKKAKEEAKATHQTSGIKRIEIGSPRLIKFNKIKNVTSPYDKYIEMIKILDEIDKAGGAARVNFDNAEFLISLRQTLEFPEELARKNLTLNPRTTKDFLDAVDTISSKLDFPDARKAIPEGIKREYKEFIENYEQQTFHDPALAKGLKSIFNSQPPQKR